MKQYLEDKIPRIERSLRRFYDRLKSNGLFFEPLEEAVIIAGGKRIRPVVVYLAHDLVGGSFEQIDDAAIIPELVHKASVVIDDLQDEAQQRDGREPLYKSYGKKIAVYTGWFLSSAPFLVLNEMVIDNTQFSEILADYNHELTKAINGQHYDISWREVVKSQTEMPTEKDYLEMAANKLAPLRFAVELGAILGHASEDKKRSLTSIADGMGAAYQLKDDLLSLDENVHDYGADITEGKLTLIVLKTLQKENNDATRLRTILSSKTRDPILIREAINIMRDNGSIEYTEQIARNLVDKAVQKLFQEFPESEHRRVFSELIGYGISREK